MGDSSTASPNGGLGLTFAQTFGGLADQQPLIAAPGIGDNTQTNIPSPYGLTYVVAGAPGYSSDGIGAADNSDAGSNSDTGSVAAQGTAAGGVGSLLPSGGVGSLLPSSTSLLTGSAIVVVVLILVLLIMGKVDSL